MEALTGSDWAGLIISIVAVGGFVVALFKFRPERNSLIAEASRSGVEILSRALDEQQRKLSDYETRTTELERQLHTSKVQIASLEAKTDVAPIMATLGHHGDILADIGRGIERLLEQNGASQQ